MKVVGRRCRTWRSRRLQRSRSWQAKCPIGVGGGGGGGSPSWAETWAGELGLRYSSSESVFSSISLGRGDTASMRSNDGPRFGEDPQEPLSHFCLNR